MFIETYSYRYAEEILQHPHYREVYEELMTAVRACPLPIYPNKSIKQPTKDVVQQAMNTYFKIFFQRHGWEKEPLATPEQSEDALRSDFRKPFHTQDGNMITAQIEVEFGNIASTYRNYFKFQLSYSYQLTDICILIVPSKDLSERIDSGVAYYEKVIREIKQADLSITVPILIIGLFDRQGDTMVSAWDLAAAGVPLAVAKNANKDVTEEHERLIRDYMNRAHL